MSKPNPRKWNPSQIVAHNMARARELRGLTQTEVAERLSRFTDAKWTKTSVAQAEGSVEGSRIRVFTAVELVALARTFDLPVIYFLAPPAESVGAQLDLPGAPADAWDYLALLVGGHMGNKDVLAERYAGYGGSFAQVNIPIGDQTDEERSVGMGYVTRSPLSPTDVWAAALHGLMLGHQRGAVYPGAQLKNVRQVLQDLVFALDSLENYRPERWVKPEVAEHMRVEREERDQRRGESLAEAREEIEPEQREERGDA